MWFFFVFGSNYYSKISKYVKSKYIIAGNTLNNEFPKKSFIKKDSILYISGGYPSYEKELLSIKFLISFCKKYSYKLFILGRNNQEQDKILIKKFGQKDLKIINNEKRFQNYKTISKFSIIVFQLSTLGYEAIARGLRAVSIGHGDFFNIRKNGPFWCSYNNNSIENLIFRTLKSPYFKWSKIYKKYSNNIMVYDHNNNKRKKIISTCLRAG